MNPRIGTHIRFDEDQTLYEALENVNDNIEDYKIPCYQIYLGKKNSCNIRKLSSRDIQDVKDITRGKGIYIHSSLINYLTNREAFRRYCKRRIVNELKTAKNFTTSGVVCHPGSRNSRGEKLEQKQALDNVVSSVVDIYKDGNSELGTLYLENSAGEGSKIFKNLEEISYIIKKIEKFKDVNNRSISNNIKICLDTCHLFAAGDYDLSKKSEIRRFKRDFEKEVGMKYLKLIHLNDSKYEFGCRKDVHEVLGEGKIWKSPKVLKYFLEQFPDVDYLCETRNFGECLSFIEKAKES